MPAIKNGKIITCLHCGKKVYQPLCRIKQGVRYCSNECFQRSDEHRIANIKKSENQKTGKWVKCEECGKKFYRTPSDVKRKTKRCSKKCVNKYFERLYKGGWNITNGCREGWKKIDQNDPQLREKRSQATKLAYKEGRLKPICGKDNWMWKGGISTLQNIERGKPQYAEWRKAVYKRDNYKCQHCGSGKDLHSHHIKLFSKYPELRYNISNGLTLCRDC